MEMRLGSDCVCQEWQGLAQTGPEEGGDLPYFTWSLGMALKRFLYCPSPNSARSRTEFLKAFVTI